MLSRIAQETKEYELLAPLAFKSADSRGREQPEEPCEFRTAFQRDRDRIIHSKAFRRLIHKTQVFLSPEGDHYRTRLTHTIEVAQVSRAVARFMQYNEDLTEAIALGHDLGHTPFGHKGEMILDKIYPGGFHHNEQSLRIVDKLETHGTRKGLNLSFEVRDGIVNHTGPDVPATLEGQIVRICDRIAYINHDIDDALRSDIIKPCDLPKPEIAILGSTHSERINNLIKDLCINSEGKSHMALSERFASSLASLRDFMFQNVYNSKLVLASLNNNKIEEVITTIFYHFVKAPYEMPDLFQDIAKIDGVECAVKDFVSGMTDVYAKELFHKLNG